MRKFKFLTLAVALVMLVASCNKSQYETKTATDVNGFTYEYVTNDPVQSRVYTLDNGLKVFLSKNEIEPRVSTLIGVRAGSTSEELNSTGLAHYFEHMMFKGTSHLGTTDWEKESVLLDQISDLFEQRRNTTDTEEQRRLYAKIDSLSVEAAQYAIPSEYDKMVASFGASGTNAGTSYDMTVYINEIPSNELEKWMKIESDRFQNIVLRLFHTELETIYEEFNMYQDRDGSRMNAAVMKALFPTHPYGRDVIGFPEHIKFPSMQDVVKFHDRYYVPNNMAVALSGDIDYDATIKLIYEYFGSWERKDLKPKEKIVEAPITEPVTVEVTGPESESVEIYYRFDATPENEIMLEAVNAILSNDKCGLIDIDLVQSQKVLDAGAYDMALNDYAMHGFYATPRENQTLEEAADMLFAELDKIKRGEFDEWVLEAALNNTRLRKVQMDEYNGARVNVYMNSFIAGKDYVDVFKNDEKFAKITKKDVIDFVNENYKNNYVIGYKRLGEPTGVVHVEKPAISTIPINRDAQSDFFKEVESMPVDEIEPVFIDYNTAIVTDNIKDGLDFYYTKNETNGIFRLYYIVDAGKDSNLKLPLALDYLKYLGTDQYTAAQLQQELYKLALNFDLRAGSDMSYVIISGLEDKFEEAVDLLENFLHNVVADKEAYDNYVDGILKKRNNAKLDPSTILWGAMRNYAIYGMENPYNTVIPEEELRAVDPQELVDIIKNMLNYEHLVFYYGPAEMADAEKIVKEKHIVADQLLPLPEEKQYPKLDVNEDKVYLVNYDMVQANMLMVSRGDLFNVNDEPFIDVFGEFYGGGLSSIVFQEIRESRSLAYSSMASINTPYKKDDYNSMFCFVGTQADKLMTATEAMSNLMNNMPMANIQFDLAKDAIIKKIRTERIVKDDVFFTWYSQKKLGIDNDYRKLIYDEVGKMDINTFHDYFNNHIAGKKYNYLIIANKNNLKLNNLAKIGEVEELNLTDIFGY